MISRNLLNRYRAEVKRVQENPLAVSDMFGSLEEALEELAQLEEDYAVQQGK